MPTILFLAHTEPDGSLARPQLEALECARQLTAGFVEATLVAGLVGPSIQPAAQSIAGCGAARFLGVAGPDYAQSRYATDAAALEAIARAVQPALVVAAATSRWNRVAPGVAHRLGGRADTHVTGVAVAEGSVRITRWYYRQRMEAVLERAQRPWFLLIEPGTQPVWSGAPGTPSVEPLLPVELGEPHRRTTVTGIQARPTTRKRSGRMRSRCLWPAPAGPRNKRTATPMRRKPKS
jgi:electron transfer flavoprotein alpha subunit